MSKATKQIGTIINRAAVDSASYNEAEGTVRVIFASEEKVFIKSWDGDYYQQLVCTKDAIRSARLDNGAVHLIDTHNDMSIENVYGRVVRWGIDTENKQCWADVKLTTDPEKAGTVGDIKAGIIRTVSIKARPWGAIQGPDVAGESIPTILITSWEPMEISLVSVPADPQSIIRQDQSDNFSLEIITKKTSEMELTFIQEIIERCDKAKLDLTFAKSLIAKDIKPEALDGAISEEVERRSKENNNPATPATQAQPQPEAPVTNSAAPAQQNASPAGAPSLEIINRCETAGFDLAFAKDLIQRNLTIDQANAAIVDEIARRNQNNGTVKNNNVPASVTNDNERVIFRTAASTALMHRAENGSVDMSKPENIKAHDFKYSTMVDIARQCLILSGDRGIYAPAEVIQRAMATTDYPDILTSTTNRFMRKYYDAVVPEWKKYGTQMNASDFRAKTGIKVDAQVTFEELAEGAEYKETKIISNEKAIIQLSTFARKFSITRKAMINDDLAVLQKLPKMIGLGARQFQARKVFALISGNALSSDGVALFQTSTHKNLASSGAAISETSLSAGRVAMRRQKSPEGNEMSIIPVYLVVPPELETTATKLVASILASAGQDVNTFYGKLKVDVVDYFTDTTAWYLAADPNAISADGIVYSYLEGQEGLFTESYIDKDTDNIVQKARMDFDARVWGHQGWYKNPGA